MSTLFHAVITAEPNHRVSVGLEDDGSERQNKPKTKLQWLLTSSRVEGYDVYEQKTILTEKDRINKIKR